jgi:probable phosphoglycerate mutase
LLARLAEMAGIVALFTHGQFGAVLEARWLLKPVSEAEQFSSGPASISVLSFEPHNPGVPVVDLLTPAAETVDTAETKSPVAHPTNA